MNLFATTPKGLEYLLVDELKALGATKAAEKLAGVEFEGDLEMAYRACLWSRFANRILHPLKEIPADSAETLYAGVQSIAWDKHLEANGSLAVHFVSVNSAITHTLFGAQKVKDAIVDQFRDKYRERPDVDRDEPDILVYVYLNRDIAKIYIDLSGVSLHKRGYRLAQMEAPLKENLAAAILTRAKWPQLSEQGQGLIDPMCGSGTLLIEAAMMASDCAPQLSRDYFGFLGWKQHQPKIWDKLFTEAKARAKAGLKNLPPIVGCDQDPEAIECSLENIERAGFAEHIHVETKPLVDLTRPDNIEKGLLIVNPPYGERLGDEEALRPLYSLLGDKLKQHFEGWQAGVFTSNIQLGKTMGLRSNKQYALFNGALPAQLLLFDVAQQYFVDRSPEAEAARAARREARKDKGK